MAVSSENNQIGPVESWLAQMRPRLHRYCARMVGSAVCGEDMVQETLIKAHDALKRGAVVRNENSWIFRIAFNTCHDYLRRERLVGSGYDEEFLEQIDSNESADKRVAVEALLSSFVTLPSQQRASVILADVLGYSLAEVSDALDVTLAAVKASLHQGRKKLRAQSHTLDAPVLHSEHRQLVRSYAESFNNRDFDSLRAMLASDVEVDLVGEQRMIGKERAGNYFSNYQKLPSIAVRPATIDGHLGVVFLTEHDPMARLQHFATLDARAGAVYLIRDYRYATYTLADATIRFFEVSD